MQDLSVGEGLVVVMFDSLGLCHFHISVNFSKKKIPSKLPIQQVSIESIPSICILSIGLAIRLIFGMRVALLVRIFEPLIHFKSDLLNYSISRTCFYSYSKLMYSCLDMIEAFISKPYNPNT